MVETRTFWEWDEAGVKRGERSYVPLEEYEGLHQVIDANERALIAAAAESEARHQSCLVLMKSVQDHQERIAELEKALRDLYDGTAEYVYLNHLGDPHNTTPMRNAAAALGLPELFSYDRLARLTRRNCDDR